ncbi:Pyridoxal kinase [Nymphon striatum]|nr:Pyridoxal kinase [Nymphon striatum]
MNLMKELRVLSIQSHVVHGYVGNKSATFPLQLHGFEVDAINSVQLSNHTVGYKKFTGQVLKSADLNDLFSGLCTNDIVKRYSHLLTGYIGSDSFLEEVCNVIKTMKAENPNLLYVCDPVMGDNGQMYVPESLLPIYQEKIIPLADILTPNQYEAQLLTGLTIKNEDDAISAMDALHHKGSKTVVLSSADLGPDSFMTTYGSHDDGIKKSRVKLEFPKISAAFTGSGDLFAASLLIWMQKSGGNLAEACEKTIATLQAVLKRTFDHYQVSTNCDEVSPSDIEMKLIQSKADIENPQVSVKCIKLS